MSIASELTNLEGNIEDSYDAVNDMGGIIPAQRNMDNLDQAIRTIPQNTGTTYTAGTGIDITSDVISVDNTTVPFFSDLATVATTGDYGDLLNTPTIPTSTSDLVNDGSDGTSTYVEADDLATVATSGLYSDLTGTPTIPAAQIQSDWTQATTTALDYIKNKPSLATVATSGSYNDLLDKPTIPAAQVQSNWTQTDTSAVDYIKNKPTIPTVNNATLTIQKNGTDVATFTANASSNVTANITVPTSFSGLSGTVSTSQIADKAVTVAKLADLTYGTGTLNTTYFSSGRVQWVKHGRMITVTMSDLALKAKPPDSTNATNAISGLPTSASWKQNDVVNLTRYGGTTVPLSLRMDGNKTALTFHYTSGTANGTYNGQFTYPAA